MSKKRNTKWVRLRVMMMKPSDTEKNLKSFSGRVRAAYNASFNTMLGKL